MRGKLEIPSTRLSGDFGVRGKKGETLQQGSIYPTERKQRKRMKRIGKRDTGSSPKKSMAEE